jgi:phosphoribosylformylglycinamidine (FGAM) synthase-like amidotransferase family enzyme
MKSAVIVFPGSNCDRDAARALERITGKPASMVWHKDTSLPEGLDLVVLPGGFSYGDYLRSGAMAAKSPSRARRYRSRRTRRARARHLQRLPSADRNAPAAGRARPQRRAQVRVQGSPLAIDNGNTASPAPIAKPAKLKFRSRTATAASSPTKTTLDRIEGEGRVVFRYLDNPNGSARDIAGIINDRGNVMGMMPHPERASDPVLGRTGGAAVFQSLMEAA